MIPIRLLATFLFAVLLLAAATAPATTLSVAPTRLELAPDRPAAAVTVTNDGKAPVLVQVETFAWRASPATADLEPTRELLAVPPLLRLAPGEKQLVRVARRSNTPLQVEETYRLLVSEVPEGGERGGVRLALRLSLPVFVTPPGARRTALAPASGSRGSRARGTQPRYRASPRPRGTDPRPWSRAAGDRSAGLCARRPDASVGARRAAS